MSHTKVRKRVSIIHWHNYVQWQKKKHTIKKIFRIPRKKNLSLTHASIYYQSSIKERGRFLTYEWTHGIWNPSALLNTLFLKNNLTDDDTSSIKIELIFTTITLLFYNNKGGLVQYSVPENSTKFLYPAKFFKGQKNKQKYPVSKSLRLQYLRILNDKDI